MDSNTISLKNQFLNSTKWSGISSIMVSSIQFLQVFILSRLLSPIDFGLMGMIMIVVGLANVIVDMGVSNGLICKQGQNQEILSSLYWLNIVSGVSVLIISYVSSPLIVFFFHEPRLYDLIFVAGLIFPISAIGQQFRFLLQKELEFKLLSKIEIVSVFLGFIISTIFALSGAGVYSLVVGQLANASIKSALLFALCYKRWPISLHFKKEDLKGYVGFGLFQMGERTVDYFNANLDYIMIGYFLGAKELGYYTFAYHLISLPIQKINPIITRVAFPIMAKIQDDTEKLKNVYFNILKFLSFLNFPILLGMSATAVYFVPIFFGEQWTESIFMVQILAIVGALKTIGNPIGALQLARGRADMGFYWNVFVFFIQLPGIFLGIYLGGYKGVAVAYLILTIIDTILYYPFLIRPFFKKSLVEYIKSMLPSLWYSTIMVVTVILIGTVLKNIDNIYILIIQVAAGIITYLLLAFCFERKAIEDLLSLVLGKSFSLKKNVQL